MRKNDVSLGAQARGRKPKLVVFDVEGVIVSKNRFFFEMGKQLQFHKFISVLFYGLLYQIGVIQLETALKHAFKNMKGMKKENLLEAARKIPVIPKAKEVFAQLKEEGYKTALVSSGLPQLIVNSIAAQLKADHAFGFEIGLNTDALTGEIWGDVVQKNGKLKILQRVVKDEGLELSECVVVADDRNNAAIYLPGMVKIGYNPDFIIRMKADHVAMDKLDKILPIIDRKSTTLDKPSMNDFRREIIHATGALIPVLSGFFGVVPIAFMICGVVAVYVISELARMEGKNMPLVSAITRRAASPTELYEFAAAPVYFAVGILVALLLFRVPVNGATIAIFAIGDSMASIFGASFGRTTLPLNRGKTLEGSMGGFFFAFLAGMFFVSPLAALAGAAVAMTVEYLPLPINDNILVPLFTGIALTLIA